MTAEKTFGSIPQRCRECEAIYPPEKNLNRRKTICQTSSAPGHNSHGFGKNDKTRQDEKRNGNKGEQRRGVCWANPSRTMNRMVISLLFRNAWFRSAEKDDPITPVPRKTSKPSQPPQITKLTSGSRDERRVNTFSSSITRNRCLRLSKARVLAIDPGAGATEATCQSAALIKKRARSNIGRFSGFL